MGEALLTLEELRVTFPTYAGLVQAVRGVSFEIKPQETVALVGESGCGKSVTALSIMGLLSRKNSRMEGRILFGGVDLVTLPERLFRGIRGKEIGMIFQDPMTALNPTMKVGNQIIEGLLRHHKISRKAARSRATQILTRVGLADATRRLEQYPHEFSGGMRQRVMIALAIACQPKLIIADEPTTALDVTIQSQVLVLLKELQEEHGCSILLITHDLGVVAKFCDRVMVMYAGQICESGTAEQIFYRAAHPYTRGLLDSIPRVHGEKMPLKAIAGSPPSLIQPMPGCPFAPRCPFAIGICAEERAAFIPQNEEGHKAACWLHDARAARALEEFKK